MEVNIKERGITLISLAVTVVVLMFLAGIIIASNKDNNGILDIANNKKEETERMTIEEGIKIELQEDPPESYADLIEFLKGYGTILNEDVPDEATLVTTKGEYKILVKDIWNTDKEELGISVGDYVEYSYDGGTYIVDGTYSGTNEEKTITIPNSGTSIWRVIDVNKQSKQVKIIPTSLNNYEITLNGVNGFNNGVKILNDLCNQIFSNTQYNATAKNINIEDIEKLSSNLSELKGVNYGIEKEYNSLVYPYVLKGENNNNSKQDDFFYNYENASNIKLMQTYYEGNIEFKSSKYNDLLPSGSYWISSRAINNTSSADYYLRTLNTVNTVTLSGTKLFNSQGQEQSNTFSVLPIVTIESNNLNSGKGTQSEPYKFE